jgi:hypothetical protein
MTVTLGFTPGEGGTPSNTGGTGDTNHPPASPVTPMMSPGNVVNTGLADPSVTGINDVPPPVPGGAHSPGKGVTTVNTDAMRTFAKNIAQLAEPLTTSMNAVQSVNVRAGAFPSAITLASKINTPQTGLRDSVVASLDQIAQAIGDTADAVSRMALAYDSGEAANKITASKYGDFMQQGSAVISSLVPAGGAGAATGSPAAGTGSTPPPSSSSSSPGGASSGGSSGGSGKQAGS